MIDVLVVGLLAGYGVAMPVGAMSVLIVTVSAQVSLRRGMAAAMGVATADGLYALAAVVGGAALSGLIASAARPFELVSAAVLALLGAFGLVSALRSRRREDAPEPLAVPAAVAVPAGQAPGRPSGPDHGQGLGVAALSRSGWRAYGAMTGLTLLNPVTVVYFGALVAGLPAGPAASAGAGAVFVAAVFCASASWQLLLAVGGAALRRLLTGPRGRLITALAGNAIILLLAVALAWPTG